MATWDLTALINAADPKSGQAERHLWLVRLMEWLRHAPTAVDSGGDQRTPLPVLRLRHLLNQLDKQPALCAKVRGLVAAFWQEIDAAALFADMGFGARRSFANELLTRLQNRVLPATPETRDLAALFRLLFVSADAQWVGALDETTLARTAAVLGPGAGQAQAALLDAITILVSAVHSGGYSPALRLRMDADVLKDAPFRQITAAAAALRAAVLEGRTDAALQDATYLRALLDACRRAAASVMPHLEEFGVSVNIVYDLEQLQARTHRIDQLVACVLAPDAQAEGLSLMLALLQALGEERGVRVLLAQHYSLLARQVAERSAETGEHYITRNHGEYRDMLKRAAGGGGVIAFTTFGKFAILAIGLSAFWTGFWAGANYAISFVIVMLLHWTVATKQPAMTAPAMAASLPSTNGADSDEAIQAFVDRVAQLIRSQVAGIIGNVAMCVPVVLGVQLLAKAVWGAPLVGTKDAHHVLESLTLLGPCVLFAAFTGVLLFVSSLVAGWAENWFVFHRLDSAIAWNPRIVARLGAARALRWSRWWRANVSGLAANISLGLLLGLVPALLGFVGLPLDVRHVTLSSGQLGAALGALGTPLLREPAFWWCVAGITVTGVLNLTVSFGLAFVVALRSRGVRLKERRRVVLAIARRLRRHPISFLWPPTSGGANAAG
jgi:site-specific recombinase